jgi:hypothetical protein
MKRPTPTGFWMEISRILFINFSYIGAFQAASDSAQEGGVVSKSDLASTGSSRFYKARQRIYGGLLLFVVVVGLPIVAVPSLRHKLATRVQLLKTAMSGVQNPVMVQVGTNHEPFPAEYEKPVPLAPSIPPPPHPVGVFSTAQGGYIPKRGGARTIAKVATKDAVPSSPASENSEITEQTETTLESGAEAQPKYQQGKIEQEAYHLLIQTNTTVAGMVQGNNPSLQFKSWDAAARGDEVYWVRLKFQPEGKPEVEYIWQVKLQSKQVAPLSYNARAIS